MADIPMIETFLTWDLEDAECGKMLQLYGDSGDVIGEEPNCQAASVCVFWSAEKARIAGLADSE